MSEYILCTVNLNISSYLSKTVLSFIYYWIMLDAVLYQRNQWSQLEGNIYLDCGFLVLLCYTDKQYTYDYISLMIGTLMIELQVLVSIFF